MGVKTKWRDKATNDRRKAIKEYWNKITKELKQKLREFLKIFHPFISNKIKEDIEINLIIDGKIENDQLKVAEELANHFSTMADDIQGWI